MIPKMQKKSFIKSPKITANYSYEDISEGTGVVAFIASTTDHEGTEGIILTTETLKAPFPVYFDLANYPRYFSSLATHTRYQTQSASYVEAMTLTMTTRAFNKTRILSGTFVLNLGCSLHVDSSSDRGAAYVVVVIKKVSSAGAETTLKTITTAERTTNAGNSGSDAAWIISGDVTTTVIKRGEKIRLTVTPYIKRNYGGAGSGYVGILVAYDPTDSAIASFGNGTSAFERLSISAGRTKTIAYIPFKITT